MIAVDSDGGAEHVGGWLTFVNASDVADEVMRRLMPNELSKETGDYIRSIARGGNYYWRETLFGGPNPISLEAVARPDGSLHLKLLDRCCNLIWQTDLRPAA